MRKYFLIALLFCVTTAYSQTYSPTGKGWTYTPKQQTDSMQVKTFFKLNGEQFRITNPVNGQIIKRSGGIWTNQNATTLAYDSLRFVSSTGQLNLWKDGTIALFTNLDGRYPLLSTFLDSITDVRSSIPVGVMLKSEYDPSGTGSGQIVNTTDVQTLVNKTMQSVTISDFSLSQHNHSSASQGGYVNSDAIVEGTTHLFSPFNYSSGSYFLPTASLGLGGVPSGYKFDVFGSARMQQLTLTSNFTFGGLTLSGVQTGTGTNSYLATKNYVDDQIVIAGGYTDEKAQDAVGTILDNGTNGDVVFTYDDTNNSISADVEDDSHAHTGTTVSGLSVSDFTSPNISAWTNDAGYVGSSYALTGALGGTISSPTIANNAVTLGKIQTVNTSTLLGRMSAGSGNVESLTVANVQGLLGLGSASYTSATDYATAGHNHDGTYQPLDGDLTSIAGLAGTSGFLKKTASNTWALDTKTYLESITSGMVTTALGYTPYNGATNPNGYITSSALTGYQAQLNGTGFVKASGTTITYDNNSYALSSHNHSGTYEVPLTFSTGLSRVGNTITSTITQYTDALARGAISLTTTGTSGVATYNSSTGVLNIPNYASSSMVYPSAGIAVSTGTAWGTSIDASTLVTNSSLSSTLGSYVTSSSLSTTLGGYATVSGVSGSYVPYSGATGDVNLGAHSITASNFTLSDRRLKDGIRPIDVTGFSPVFYRFNMISDPSKKTHYGVIAQEVEEYAPELVKQDENGVKSVNYIELLVRECARLEAIVKSLENRIKTLENEK